MVSMSDCIIAGFNKEKCRYREISDQIKREFTRLARGVDRTLNSVIQSFERESSRIDFCQRLLLVKLLHLDLFGDLKTDLLMVRRILGRDNASVLNHDPINTRSMPLLTSST